MRRHLLDIAVLLAGATLTAGFVVLTQPSVRGITLRAYALAVGALLMLGIVSALGDALPRRRSSPLDQALSASPDGEPRRPAQLERLEREVTLAVASAQDLHHRLLPQLREIARCRLERSGARPGPETLGAWWELLRPDLAEPDDRFAPGIPEHELRALVADLERL